MTSYLDILTGAVNQNSFSLCSDWMPGTFDKHHELQLLPLLAMKELSSVKYHNFCNICYFYC
jgi:hypothetical protein